MAGSRHAVLVSLALAALTATGSVHAVDLQLSGFLSVVGGKVLDGTVAEPLPADPGLNCPCYVADFFNFGAYGSGFSLAPETRVEVQADMQWNPRWRATVQLTSRGVRSQPELQWAYLTYALSADWDFQVERKRISLYFYSDFQDVGHAYPWVGVPQELYG